MDEAAREHCLELISSDVRGQSSGAGRGSETFASLPASQVSPACQPPSISISQARGGGGANYRHGRPYKSSVRSISARNLSRLLPKPSAISSLILLRQGAGRDGGLGGVVGEPARGGREGGREGRGGGQDTGSLTSLSPHLPRHPGLHNGVGVSGGLGLNC